MKEYDWQGQSKFSTWVGFQFGPQEDGSFGGTVTLSELQEGPPLHAHGGVLASLLDEVMGATVWDTGKRVLAANLNMDYRRPVPLGTPIFVTGRLERIEGRKFYARGQIILPDGSVAVEGTGLFIEANMNNLVDANRKYIGHEREDDEAAT